MHRKSNKGRGNRKKRRDNNIYSTHVHVHKRIYGHGAD